MDLSELKTIAALANLDLTEKELSSLEGETRKMLGLFSKMRDADVDKLLTRRREQITGHRLRRDEAAQDIHPDALLERAPELEDRFIVIPNVL